MTARAFKIPARTADDTIVWYDREASAYAADTLNRNPVELRETFVRRLPPGGVILDAGSGSGRDTLAFLKLGFDVEAFDASEELARFSSVLTSRPTRTARFETFIGPPARYDGIWAFASLLHVREVELPDALARLSKTLKPGGWIFANFKAGHGERLDEFGRTYTDMDEPRLRRLFLDLGLWTRIEISVQQAEAAFGTTTDWINVFAQRAG